MAFQLTKSELLSNSIVFLSANNAGGTRHATTREAVEAALIHLQKRTPATHVLLKVWVVEVDWQENIRSQEAYKGSVDWQEGDVLVSLQATAEVCEQAPPFDFEATVNALTDSLTELRLLRAHVDDILAD